MKSAISFRNAFVLDKGTNLERHFDTNPSHVVIDLAGKEFNHTFDLSFNDKGNRRTLTHLKNLGT